MELWKPGRYPDPFYEMFKPLSQALACESEDIGTLDVDDTEWYVRIMQRLLWCESDGVVGDETRRAMTKALSLYAPLMGIERGPSWDDGHHAPWQDRLNSAIMALSGGMVGYGTPTQSDKANLARPLAQRYMCERLRPEEAAKARQRGYTTTHTAGGCGSLAERVLALTLGDPTPHFCANQTAPFIPPSQRDPKFAAINDNTPGAMLSGVQAIKAKGWTAVCEGYAFAMDYARLAWGDIPGAMMRLAAPLAIVHQPSGHVWMALLSDSWQRTTTRCHWTMRHQHQTLELPSGVLRLAADGGAASVGRPTTLCYYHVYPAFAGKAHVFFVMRPGSLPDADASLRMMLEV